MHPAVAAALLSTEADIGLGEVLDVAWLARRMTGATPPVQDEETPPDPALGSEPGGAPRESTAPTSGPGQAGAGMDVHLLRAGSVLSAAGRVSGGGVQGPAPTWTLPHRLGLAGALRELRRTSPSPVATEVDENATAEQWATSGMLVPVSTPAKEPHFELTLVCDTGASMRLWDRMLREMAVGAARHGAFRSVTVRRLRSDANPVALTGRGGATGLGELIQPNGRRIVAFVTDGVNRGWHDGQLARHAHRLSRYGPVVVIHLLPRRLWPRTGVNPLPVYLRTDGEGVGDVPCRVRPDRFTPAGWSWGDLRPGEPPWKTDPPLAVPVVSLDPASLRRWVAFLSGQPGQVLSGSAWIVTADGQAGDGPPDEQPDTMDAAVRGDTSPGRLIREFDATASPRARRLLRSLATAPLNLDTMWLVHTATSRQRNQCSDPAPLAEVFLGGLLRRAPGSGAQGDGQPGGEDYEFVDGVRGLLLGGLERGEAIDTFMTVSREVAHRLRRSPLAFPALLASPGDTELIRQIDAEFQPLARVAAEILKGLGPAYRSAVERIEQAAARGVPVTAPQGQGHVQGLVQGPVQVPASAAGAASDRGAARRRRRSDDRWTGEPAPGERAAGEPVPGERSRQHTEGRPAPTAPPRAPVDDDSAADARVAVLGANMCGKTTFLAAAWLAAVNMPEERGRWNVIPKDGGAEDFLVQQTRSLARARRFPEPTLTPRHFSYVFRADLANLRAPSERRLRVDFTLDLLDAGGGEFMHDRYGKDDAVNRHLGRSNRILLLVDPFSPPSRQPQAAYLTPHLERLTRDHFESGRLELGRLPHRVAVCLSKFDDPRVFRDARRGNWVGQNEQGDPCVPPEDAEGFISWLGRSSQDIAEIVRLVRLNFLEERVHWFVLSAIGIHRRRDGSVDFDDCSNQTRDEDGIPMLRGQARPLNVLEPLVALGRTRTESEEPGKRRRRRGER
ncbi:SAV_2336 N-terminal domain-related protein [Streptomyces sp. HNM0663]|uniref:SAV_2336 N-terminal domain-related protein n=1 Tax=Streptomyces chengmaiensis TaxID=3040919 RepID=A0ABT6HKY8_9ACTN|nr:SAV_2336 N-terminal domain-related protein [Streptomyces chengmaiensis]MDH2389285.1 SAV_2336 N-terminal domain-related protein [Streptomyces chengmaiensis]